MRKYDIPEGLPQNRKHDQNLKLCPIFLGFWQVNNDCTYQSDEALKMWEFARCRAEVCHWWMKNDCAVKVEKKSRSFLSWLFGG